MVKGLGIYNLTAAVRMKITASLAGASNVNSEHASMFPLLSPLWFFKTLIQKARRESEPYNLGWQYESDL